MKKFLVASALSVVLAATAVQAEPVSYEFDKAHTSIEFYIDHLGFSQFQGEFQGFEGTLTFDEAKPENSAVAVTIDVNSIDTDVEALDKHLKSVFAQPTFSESSSCRRSISRSLVLPLSSCLDLGVSF